MKIKERVEKIGNFFFKWRSFIPLVLVPFLFFVLKNKSLYNESLFFKWFCFNVSLIGIIIRCLVAGYVPKGTSGRVSKQEAEKLNTTGLYSILRHPLYVGNFFIFLGLLLYTENFWFILVCIFLFIPYYTSIIFAEEKFLKEKFDEIYLKYYQTTPAIIPKFTHWQKPELPFSFKSLIDREFQTLFGMIIGFNLTDTLKQILVYRKIVNFFWLKFFLITLIFYVLLTILKIKTDLLKVDNR